MRGKRHYDDSLANTVNKLGQKLGIDTSMASQVQKYFTRRLEEVNLLNVNMLDLNYFSMFDAPTGFIFYLEEIRGITNRRPTEVF